MQDEPDRTATAHHGPVTEWLLACDPAVRWQVMRDLLGAPAEEVAAERSRVGAEGRCPAAVDLVAAKRDPQGRWPLEVRQTGRLPVDLGEEPGHPRRWVTLRALRVLHWAASG